MKVKIVAALATALVLATSCGLLGTAPANTAAPSAADSGLAAVLGGTQTGNTAGSALLGLFTQYKADGKMDLTNVNNILNLATLVNNVKGLKTNNNSGSYLADFASGLIKGSKSLVNQNNSTDVINGLVKLSGLNLNNITNTANTIASGTEQAAATAAQKINTTSSQVTSAVNTLSSIFSLLK